MTVAKIPAIIQITSENGPSSPAVIAEAIYMSAPITDPTTILVRSKRESSFLKSMVNYAILIGTGNP